MAWYDSIIGTPARTQQLQTFSPQQRGLQNESINQIMSLLQGKPSQGFQPIAQNARNQFQQQTVPTLAERFTSMGGAGTGALSSPAFASQLGQAGAGLEGNLAALGSQFGQNQLQSLLPFAGKSQFENLFHQAQPGALQNIAGPALQLLMMYLSGGLSGGAGLGSGAGSGLQSLGGGF